MLNSSHYGPAIPPHKSYHHRRSGCCCGGCFGCCCGCIFKLLAAAVFAVGIVVLVLWLVFRPHNVKFRVADAELSEFTLDTTTNALRYDLNLTLTIRNPNKRVGIYYDVIEARPYWVGHRFGSVMLPAFYGGHENSTALNARFRGQAFVPLQESEKSLFESEKASGVFGIDVKLYLRIRLRVFWGIKSPKLNPRIKCDLKVPLTRNSSSPSAASGFQSKRCEFDFDF